MENMGKKRFYQPDAKWLVAILAFLLAWLIRAWMWTLRLAVRYDDESGYAHSPKCTRGYIHATWHDMLFLPLAHFGRINPHLLISQSRDGDYITRVVGHMGWRVIRGSSTRGAVAALRNMIKAGSGQRQDQIAMTSDGPRGPRHVLKGGCVYLAAKSGMPIVPTIFVVDKCWRFGSWDRTLVPYPFAKGVLLGGKPISVPPDADRAALEAIRRQVQAEMWRLEELGCTMLNLPRPDNPDDVSIGSGEENSTLADDCNANLAA